MYLFSNLMLLYITKLSPLDDFLTGIYVLGALSKTIVFPSFSLQLQRIRASEI